MRGAWNILALVIVAAFYLSCARDRTPTFHAEGEMLAQIYQEYGRKAMDKGDYRTAISYYTKAIDEVGESFVSLTERSDAFRLLGDRENAVEDIYSAFQLSMQQYYSTGDPLRLHLSAYCVFLIGDKDLGDLMLGLLQERHVEYAKGTESLFGKDYFQLVGEDAYRKGFKLIPE